MSHTVRLDTSDQDSESFNEEPQEEQIEEPLYYILNDLLVSDKGENIATLLSKMVSELGAMRVALDKLATASSSTSQKTSSGEEAAH